MSKPGKCTIAPYCSNKMPPGVFGWCADCKALGLLSRSLLDCSDPTKGTPERESRIRRYAARVAANLPIFPLTRKVVRHGGR